MQCLYREETTHTHYPGLRRQENVAPLRAVRKARASGTKIDEKSSIVVL